MAVLGAHESGDVDLSVSNESATLLPSELTPRLRASTLTHTSHLLTCRSSTSISLCSVFSRSLHLQSAP